MDTFSRPYESNTFWLIAKKNAVVDLGSVVTAKQLPLDEACCIILTHLHYDHTAALDQLKLPDKTVIMMHEADAKEIGTSASAAHFLAHVRLSFASILCLRTAQKLISVIRRCA